MVDETIYRRSDLCVANIVSKRNVEHDVYAIGTKLEISLNDVVEVRDVASGDVLYQRHVAGGA